MGQEFGLQSIMKNYPSGIADGWPGTYWLKHVAGMELKGKEDELQVIIAKYKQQCIDAYTLKREARPIDGLNGFLDQVCGINRAKVWILQSKLRSSSETATCGASSPVLLPKSRNATHSEDPA